MQARDAALQMQQLQGGEAEHVDVHTFASQLAAATRTLTFVRKGMGSAHGHVSLVSTRCPWQLDGSMRALNAAAGLCYICNDLHHLGH
jgi:hypothetical protein